MGTTSEKMSDFKGVCEGFSVGYRYLGSKARVVDEVMHIIGTPEYGCSRFIDSFSGTGVVASAAADRGWKVLINDFMSNAALISESRLLAVSDVPFVEFGGYAGVISVLNQLPGREGFITREYSPRSLDLVGVERRYFTTINAERIDAVTETIHQWKRDGRINEKEFALLISDVILATNSVANIAGTYGCFMSKWTSTSQTVFRITPRPLREEPVDYEVMNRDVFDVPSFESDVVYLDPPYTKRQYASYYHIQETIAKGDCPKVEGVCGLRPWEDHSSVFCYKKKALDSLISLISKQDAKVVYLSYSDEGHVDLDELKSRLDKMGETIVHPLSIIGRYRPNKVALNNRDSVQEYLVEFRKVNG